jgi:hypothetical protein
VGVPKLSEIDAPGKPEEMYRDENGAICYNQQREVHQWAEREYRLNSLAASFQQKLTHNPKFIVPWFSNSYGKNRNCPNSKNIAAYSN